MRLSRDIFRENEDCEECSYSESKACDSPVCLNKNKCLGGQMEIIPEAPFVEYHA